MELINRPLYSQQLEKLRDREEVKILTGARGVGKTSLLNLFAQDLANSGVPVENIIHIDFDTLNFQNVGDKNLYNMLAAQMSDNEKNYLLLDEILQVPNWQADIAKLQKDFKADVYITSSLEIPEEDTKDFFKTVIVNVLPLSFLEFQTFYTFDGSVTQNERFEMYLKFGGMPLAIRTLPQESAAVSVMSNNFYAAVLRDVVVGSKITDFDLMVALVQKIFQRAGTIQSYNKFSKMFSDNPPAVRTVENYVNHLCSAHILYALPVTDFRRDNTLKRLAKYYPVDFGYNTLLVGQINVITQEILESVVYCELLRRGFEVSAYRVKNSLVFQVERGELGDRIYISVDKRLNAASYVPLRAIKNLFAKWVITAEENVTNSADGIKVANILDFLTKELR